MNMMIVNVMKNEAGFFLHVIMHEMKSRSIYGSLTYCFQMLAKWLFEKCEESGKESLL